MYEGFLVIFLEFFSHFSVFLDFGAVFRVKNDYFSRNHTSGDPIDTQLWGTLNNGEKDFWEFFWNFWSRGGHVKNRAAARPIVCPHTVKFLRMVHVGPFRAACPYRATRS